MGDAHLQEASAAAQMVVGFSTYLHGTDYDVDQFKRELEQAAAYIGSQQGKEAA